uniref:Uncharacterized protein n=1 Tax=Oryza meridionalis TaxID=40149 RepID=A0A0E0DBE1_9ORYZ
MPPRRATVAKPSADTEPPSLSLLCESSNCLRLIREYHVQILLKAQFFILFIGLLSLVVSGGPGCMDGLQVVSLANDGK